MSTMNPEQQAAIEHGKGPLRLGAVAGSGKTTALVERVAYLVEKRGVHPDSILMISFSRVARDEMKKRIDRRLPTYGAGRCARTFHSIGLDIFNAEFRDARDMAIDTTGLFHAMATSQAYRNLGLEPERKLIKRFSSTVKNGLMSTPEALRRLGKVDAGMVDLARSMIQEGTGKMGPDDLVSAYFRTEDIRQREGIEHNGARVRFVTFDDMIFESAQLLKYEDIRERWGNRWSHVLQDEAQDVNAAQNFIAQALAHKHRNYVIVGDPAQSVYGFRGANPQSMLDFEKEWPGAKTVVMHRNYRSGIEIVKLANDIMGNMPANTVITDDMGVATDMVSERNTHAFVGAHLYPDSTAEADAIAANAKQHFHEHVPWEEQAVLVRMNRMTKDIEIAMAKRSIPYKLISGSSFFSMRETMILVGYMRVIAGRANPEDFKHSVLFPKRGVSRQVVNTIVEKTPESNDWVQVVRAFAPSLRLFQANALTGWCHVIDDMRQMVERDEPPKVIASRIVSETKMDDWLKKDADDAEDSRALDDLFNVVDFCGEYDSVRSLLDAVDEIEAHRRDNMRKRKAVSISTVHKAKGREWSTVFLPQMCHGLFPAVAADLAEERRVLYVAVTRAKDELWISMPKTSDDEVNAPSSLLTECDVEWSDEAPIGKQVDPNRVGTQLGLLIE